MPLIASALIYCVPRQRYYPYCRLPTFSSMSPMKLIYQCRCLPPLSSMPPMKLSSNAISHRRSPCNTPLINPNHAVSCCRTLTCCLMKVISDTTDCLCSHPLCAPLKILFLLSLADFLTHAPHEFNIPMPLIAAALIHAPDEAIIRCHLPSKATL